MHIKILCIQHDLILRGVFTLYVATITIMLRCITISGVKDIIFFQPVSKYSAPITLRMRDYTSL